MAFVVARRDGRFEIRESVSTGAGPRARTLATFRTLSDEVLDRAEARATTPFDRASVSLRAARAGAPRVGDETARIGWELLTRLGRPDGPPLPPALAAALTARLTGTDAALPDSLPPLLDWIGVGPRERGDALRDLLRLTDRIPARPERPRRRFPRIASARVLRPRSRVRIRRAKTERGKDATRAPIGNL